MKDYQHLLKRIALSDEDAFHQLYNDCSTRVFYAAIKFGLEREDALEIVQDVFLRIWQRREHLSSDMNIQAYLLAIAKNLLINRAKKQAYETAYKKYLHKINIESVRNNGADGLEYDELKKTTDDCINRLPEQQKMIFLLARNEFLSHKEISDRLGISLRTVENQIYRATKTLKCEIKKHYP
ncbi:MAG: RNA polymerase sigma-70 factor [Cyclobacteriaceae bacterium]|nr:RNA polymerase sigma-70 factor [Cyclobacteriaceae bacterium]